MAPEKKKRKVPIPELVEVFKKLRTNQGVQKIIFDDKKVGGHKDDQIEASVVYFDGRMVPVAAIEDMSNSISISAELHASEEQLLQRSTDHHRGLLRCFFAFSPPIDPFDGVLTVYKRVDGSLFQLVRSLGRSLMTSNFLNSITLTELLLQIIKMVTFLHQHDITVGNLNLDKIHYTLGAKGKANLLLDYEMKEHIGALNERKRKDWKDFGLLIPAMQNVLHKYTKKSTIETIEFRRLREYLATDNLDLGIMPGQILDDPAFWVKKRIFFLFTYVRVILTLKKTQPNHLIFNAMEAHKGDIMPGGENWKSVFDNDLIETAELERRAYLIRNLQNDPTFGVGLNEHRRNKAAYVKVDANEEYVYDGRSPMQYVCFMRNNLGHQKNTNFKDSIFRSETTFREKKESTIMTLSALASEHKLNIWC